MEIEILNFEYYSSGTCDQDKYQVGQRFSVQAVKETGFISRVDKVQAGAILKGTMASEMGWAWHQFYEIQVIE